MEPQTKTLVIGIQGGKGSFNEQACLHLLEKKGILNYKLEYLHTTDKVLMALKHKSIDIGQFAVHNIVGGIVDESFEAMGRFNFSLKESFSIPISHNLMVHPDSSIEHIQAFMTHPQVYRQCEKNLKTRFPHIEQRIGDKDMIDSSRVGQAIASGELPPTIAVIGNKQIAETYGLKLAVTNLEDSPSNSTTFIWVE